MKMTPFSVCLALMFGLCQGKISEIPLPKEIQDCYNKVQSADIETYIGSKFSWSCENIILDSQMNKSAPLDDKTISYYNHLLEIAMIYLPDNTNGTTVPRRKRQASRPRCVRREYRAMSDAERERFHSAVNSLKRDTTVPPNKYDAMANIHANYLNSAHSGAGFTGWHRLYLRVFEAAVREKDPSVCMPYWDTTLDNELDEPALSSVWTPAFFGTPNGPVVTGPFANWRTPNGAPLIRNVGMDGELISARAMEDILSRRRYEDITFSPGVQRRFNLELHHNGIHIFCGGTLNRLSTAAFDPVFFLLHAFVDFIWELFRANLQNPELYPDLVPPTSPHHSSAPTGFGSLRQRDAYGIAITETYEYEPPPTCSSQSPQCPSRYLTCLERIGRCVPIDAARALLLQPDSAVALSVVSQDSQPPGPANSPGPLSLGSQPPGYVQNDTRCLPQEKSYSQAIQNDFCADNICDSNEWVMIAVGIISVRPPNFKQYHSYPVHKGRVDRHHDIYSPRAYNNTNRLITQRQSNPKTYTRCKGDNSVGQVFLSSRGINYEGYYKAKAFIDQRLAVSMSVGVVAVKKPTKAAVSEALIRAHDSCGRVCQAACKDKRTGQYKKCKGAIAVSSDQPLMYGANYGEAVMNVFDYKFNLPQFKDNNVFLTFHCDYLSNFPYTDYKNGVVPQPAVVVEPPVVPQSNTECVVTPQCVLDIPCASMDRQCKVYNEKHVCRGSCQSYAVCIYARFFMKVCPEGHSFDNVRKICLPGGCQNNQSYPQTIPIIEGNPYRTVSG
uniref:Tyrosinase n=1 Tax=Cepaea nemoralis TaxID=28835 RepID=A0A6B9QJU3_CEPNE|nr:tyrosinase [Cepaea nemoralis]